MTNADDREPVRFTVTGRTIVMALAMLVGSGGVGGGLSLASGSSDEVAELAREVKGMRSEISKMHAWQVGRDVSLTVLERDVLDLKDRVRVLEGIARD